MDQSAAAEPIARPRRGWLAALLSIFWPGLGHLHIGQVRRALLAFAFYTVVVLLIYSSTWVPTGRLVFLVELLAVLPYLLIIIDAWRQGRRRRDYVLRPFNRWWVYLSVIVAFAVMNATTQPFPTLLHSTSSFYFPSRSMGPTTLVGDYLIADTYAPRLVDVRRGDVILFLHDGAVFMKRVAGVPGDSVAMDGGVLTINGKAIPHDQEATLQEGAISPEEAEGATLYRETWPDGRQVLVLQRGRSGPIDSFPAITVPESSYFVLGDTRHNSRDSRVFGFVGRDQLVGRASFIYWSQHLSRIGRLID
jgi:signal peptidase I